MLTREPEQAAISVSRSLEQRIYSLVCQRDGITAREIAKELNTDHRTVNLELYRSALMREMCYSDDQHRWYGLIRQSVPREGLYDFSGWYGRVREFLALDEEAFMEELCSGCRRIGRSLNDARGVLHSFRDCREQMRALFRDLERFIGASYREWEIAFEVRFNRARYIRVYADVLLMTRDRVFTLEFKMKDRAIMEELEQAVKYVPYLQVLLGEKVKVIPALVLTAARDRFETVPVPGSGSVRVCSGDMLFNVLDDEMHFLL